MTKGPSAQGDAPPVTSLGRLERAVMDRVWAAVREVTVHDVRERLGVPLAYTTIMTTLDRLYKKGLVSRRKEGRAFVYTARVSPADLSRRAVSTLVSQWLWRTPDPSPVLHSLVDAVSERDERLLGDLERLVAAKRRQLEREP